ncbi:unnamed protein product [Cunninghamella blakesleeana]
MERTSISSNGSSSGNSPITPHPTISTTSTKTTPSTRTSLITCACHHWLVSMDSEHCAICDDPIHYLTEWQTERIERSKELRKYKRQLMDTTTIQDQQQNDMMALQKQILDHRENLMIRDDEMISLHQDMEKLQTKYNEESAQIEAIEVEKRAARKEIEDLGQHLFKEARDMVATEKNEILELQQSNDHLKQQLHDAQSELDKTNSDLKLLKMEMSKYDDDCYYQDNNNMAILLRQRQQQYRNNNNNNYNNNNNNNNIDDDKNINNNIDDDDDNSNSNNNNDNDNDINNNNNSKNIKNLMLNTSSNVNNNNNNNSSSSNSDDFIKIPTTPSQAYHLRAHIDLLSLQENNPLKESIQLETFEDDQQLTEFQEFLDSATSTTFSLKKLHGLPFMILCLQDDIEPCLRFGSQPKVTGKKILEAIQIKTCFVERCPPGFVREYADYVRRERYAKKSKPSLWDKISSRSSSSSPSSSPTISTSTSTSTSSTSATSASDDTNLDGYLACTACGRKVKDNEDDATLMEKELCYRFRISYFDEWSCIDRYCANRLNSVIAFYAFLRQLRLSNFKERSLMDIYQECSRLRLQMCLSRMGTLPNLTTIQ